MQGKLLTAERCALTLPAGLARLACGFAIILVGESFPPASSATTGARPAASGLGTRLVHFQVASAQLFSVKACNRFGGFFVVGHFHKGEPAGTASLPVHDQVDARHLSERRKQRI